MILRQKPIEIEKHPERLHLCCLVSFALCLILLFSLLKSSTSYEVESYTYAKVRNVWMKAKWDGIRKKSLSWMIDIFFDWILCSLDIIRREREKSDSPAHTERNDEWNISIKTLFFLIRASHSRWFSVSKAKVEGDGMCVDDGSLT